MTYAMIDIETLGLNFDAAIMQIGIVTNEGAKQEWTIDMADALDYGTVGADTLKFWFEQSDAARESVTNSFYTLREALSALNDFIISYEVDYIWSHASFDIPILVNAFNKVGIHPVWNHRDTRDLRTIEHFVGNKITWSDRQDIKHTALADAVYQMDHLELMLKELDNER